MTRDIGFTAAAGDSGSELALRPYRRDICATYVMLTLTTAALVLAFRQLGGSLVHELAAHQWSIAVGQLAFMLVVALLLWGNFVYQLTRLGHVYRCATHRPALREDLERTYDDHAQPLAILVPSYKEEIGVVRCARHRFLPCTRAPGSPAVAHDRRKYVPSPRATPADASRSGTHVPSASADKRSYPRAAVRQPA